jgi:predicted DNA binding CopG/RHH family protein
VPKRRYQRVPHPESGLTFVFAYDCDAPELLHIFSRHATSPGDAVDAFFEGREDTTWNDEYERYETSGEHHRALLVLDQARRGRDGHQLLPLMTGQVTPHGRRLGEATDIELSPEEDEHAQQAIEQAEHDIAELDEVRVNFRWGRAQLDLVKRAAASYGVPYQTYLKMVVLRAAQADLEQTTARSVRG